MRHCRSRIAYRGLLLVGMIVRRPLAKKTIGRYLLTITRLPRSLKVKLADVRENPAMFKARDYGEPKHGLNWVL